MQAACATPAPSSAPPVHPAEVPGRALRQALGHYPTGVTVITTRAPDGRPVGLTCNSFASLSLDPPLVLWSLARRSPNLAVFRETTHFAINVLSAGQADLARRFANSAVADKFEGVALREPWQGVPLIEGSLAWFGCSSRDAIDAGDHTLFIGHVDTHAVLDAEPLVFHRGAFR